MKLQGMSALVSGGGGAIGRAIALKLAEAGSDVAVVDLDAVKADAVADEVRSRGRRGIACVCDIRSHDAVRDGVETIATELGAIDIVVNAAGGSARSRMACFEKLDLEVFDRILDVNLRGALYLIHAALPHLVRRKYGKIVNIASIVALGGKERCVDYAAAKGGLLAATRSLALELGRYNITVNCVSPGLVPRPDALPSDPAAFARRHTCLHRTCSQEDVAQAVLYLVSPAADGITGQNLVVDGGRSLGLRGDT